jgi:hypothetical protein
MKKVFQRRAAMSSTQDPTAGMTPEQKEEFVRNYHQTSITAIDFMEAHLLDPEGPIVQCVENSEAISKYIVAHQKPWSVASLDEALKNLSALGKIKRGVPISDELNARKAVDDKAASDAAQHARDTEFPWGSKLVPENDGARRVLKMSREDYKRYMSDNNFGREFVRQVEALKITDRALSGRL